MSLTVLCSVNHFFCGGFTALSLQSSPLTLLLPSCPHCCVLVHHNPLLNYWLTSPLSSRVGIPFPHPVQSRGLSYPPTLCRLLTLHFTGEKYRAEPTKLRIFNHSGYCMWALVCRGSAMALSCLLLKMVNAIFFSFFLYLWWRGLVSKRKEMLSGSVPYPSLASVPKSSGPVVLSRSATQETTAFTLMTNL